MVGIEDRAIGGAQPPKPVAELFALEFEQPFLTGVQRRTRGGVDDARRDISMNPADRTALFGPMLAEIIDRPAGDRARKFGRAIIGADRDIIFFEEGIDQIGRESSEERRVGKECVSTCKSGWSPYH